MGTYLKNVVTLGLDLDKCIGCGMCTEVCPHAVFFIREGKARIRDRDACMECGACQRNCPVQAITVQAGVGCAQAVLRSWTTGKTGCGCDAPSCSGLSDGRKGTANERR